MFLKRNNDELKADRPTLEENKLIPKLPVSFLLENIRSVHNVGSVFRTCDGIGCEKIYLSGYTAFPPRKDLSKVALGAENSVLWEQFDDPIEAAESIKSKKIQLVSLEQTYSSKSKFPAKVQYCPYMYSQSPNEILINKTKDAKYFNIFTSLNLIETAQNVHSIGNIIDKISL